MVFTQKEIRCCHEQKTTEMIIASIQTNPSSWRWWELLTETYWRGKRRRAKLLCLKAASHDPRTTDRHLQEAVSHLLLPLQWHNTPKSSARIWKKDFFQEIKVVIPPLFDLCTFHRVSGLDCITEKSNYITKIMYLYLGKITIDCLNLAKAQVECCSCYSPQQVLAV